MDKEAPDLARRLGDVAEAVCRHYLSNGVREGFYWRVGDVHNAPGRSMFVRLRESADGRAAGRWTDAATGEHGDLLDLIGANRNLADFRAILDEARGFLALPRPAPPASPLIEPAASPASARRLFAASKTIAGTIGETYLRQRGIRLTRLERAALRFHPRCFYRTDDAAPKQTRPALIAAVTDIHGAITGVHRTYIQSTEPPRVFDRRALGRLYGSAARCGPSSDVLIAGEGIETTLSLRTVLPIMPLAAALSAPHLAAMEFDPRLKRLYVARDADAAGDYAFLRLQERADAAGVEFIGLSPRLDDFNTDLRRFGPAALATALAPQLHGDDRARFLAA